MKRDSGGEGPLLRSVILVLISVGLLLGGLLLGAGCAVDAPSGQSIDREVDLGVNIAVDGGDEDGTLPDGGILDGPDVGNPGESDAGPGGEDTGNEELDGGDHLPPEGPQVSFLVPSDGDRILGKVMVHLDVAAPAGLDRVVMAVDGEQVGFVWGDPYRWEWDSSHWTPGSYELKATVIDLIGQSAFDSVTVTVLPGIVVPIFNPYVNVDWGTYGQHKGNFHTHTTKSDGREHPTAVIDAYRAMGYEILAFADHNTVTWPWQDYDRDPPSIEMIAVQGCEPSRHHHMGSFYNGYNGSSFNVHTSLQTIGSNGGLAVMFHPGRYSESVQWYVDLYMQYDHLIGMEVYNQGDRYPGDRALWDQVLIALMPQRPVWGYSNDDSHRMSHVGRNGQTLLLPELTEQAVRDAKVNGEFYFHYTPTLGDPFPTIQEIEVDQYLGSISILAEGYTEIRWVSAGVTLELGRSSLDVANLQGYVRAELQGPTGRSYTQPFFVGDPELGTVLPTPGIRVGLDGVPVNGFNYWPRTGDGWSTQSLSGSNSSHTGVAGLDAAVQTLNAVHNWRELGQSSTWPPSTNGLARYNSNSSSGKKIQTRPTVVAATVLMATLLNNTGDTVSDITVSYDFGSWLLQENEHVYGHRAFYSLTGEPNSWQLIPAFSSSSQTQSAGETALSADLALGAWQPDATLYIIWADDNGPGGSTNSGTGREGAYTIDNFAVENVQLAAAN